MAFDYTKVGKYFRRNIMQTVDEMVDDYVVNEIVGICHELGITTESDFAKACRTNRTLMNIINSLVDYANDNIRRHLVLSYKDAHAVIDDIDQYTSWDYIFEDYWIPRDLVDLAVILLKFEFDIDGEKALISELYDIVEPILN